MVYHQVYSQGDQYGCGTYSPAWVERYLEKEYLRIDLVILGCYQRFHPIDWKRLDWSSKAACGFRAEAMEYWVGHQGFSIPMTGPNGQYAFFMASHHCSDEDWQTFKNEHSTS
ncbi:autoinducer binding domain-containing protein [Planktotalea sp.]|uniref:autoinducer binding domain-containing protein n=1 Tax=Planktotalea sp. TaxID=2029877 RepID=UPI00341F049F